MNSPRSSLCFITFGNAFAPTPVSAYLHSAAMVKLGVFLMARLWPVLSGTRVSGNTFRFGPMTASALVPGLAGRTGVDVVARVMTQDVVGNETVNEAAVKRSFDFQAPTVSGVSVTYPTSPIESGKLLRREVDPARLSANRRDRATLNATIRDVATNTSGLEFGIGAGIDPATRDALRTGVPQTP